MGSPAQHSPEFREQKAKGSTWQARFIQYQEGCREGRAVPTPALIPRRDWSGPAAQQDVWERRKERSGKREGCAGSMQQAEIPGRSKHREKGGFV